jgi:hypothetical protein
MRAALRIGQLHIDSNRCTGSPKASFDNIANAKFTTDFSHVNRLSLESKSRVAGDHKSTGNPREIGGQVVGDPIGDKLQLQIIREVGKGQDHNRKARRSTSGYRLAGRLLLPDRAHKTNAFADCRADEPLLFAAVLDHAARGVDAAGERRLRHDASAPYRSEQIVSAHQSIAIADQKLQQIEYLRLHRQQRGSSAQLAPIGVENVSFEQEPHF